MGVILPFWFAAGFRLSTYYHEVYSFYTWCLLIYGYLVISLVYKLVQLCSNYSRVDMCNMHTTKQSQLRAVKAMIMHGR